LTGTTSTGFYAKVGFWLEYTDSSLTKTANRVTDFDVLYYNTTTDLGGDNNGCDGPFQNACMEELKQQLKVQVPSIIKPMDTQGLPPAGFLERALGQAILSSVCPSDLLNVWRPSSGFIKSKRE
jgi:hypothetical protein